MEERNVPYIVYESAEAKSERCIKRLVIALIIAICLLFASNMAWLYAWMQYDYADSEIVTVDSGEGDGNANYIQNGGTINNGTGDSGQN